MKVNEYKNGDVVFRQGEFATTFYKILSGSVGVYVGYGSGRRWKKSQKRNWTATSKIGAMTCSRSCAGLPGA